MPARDVHAARGALDLDESDFTPRPKPVTGHAMEPIEDRQTKRPLVVRMVVLMSSDRIINRRQRDGERLRQDLGPSALPGSRTLIPR